MLFIKKKILYKEWLKIWLLNKKDYVKESTYAHYTNIVYNHLILELGDYKINEINNDKLQKLILNKYSSGRLDNFGGLSDRTVKDIVALIKMSLKGAIKKGLISNIDLTFAYPVNTAKDKIYVLRKSEQKTLITYILSEPNSRSLGILLALFSGLRIGELCALKWEDIDFDRNIIKVNKTLQRIYTKHGSNSGNSKIVISSPKSKKANRDIPLNKDFSLILKKFKTKKNHYFLSCTEKYIEPRNTRKHFNKILEKTDINHINFHSLRHTFATNCIRHGTDYKTVSELLGHSTIAITLNLYVHSHMSQKKKCINSIYKEFQTK